MAGAAAAIAIFQIGVQFMQSQAAAEEERLYDEAVARFNADQQARQDAWRRQRAAELAVRQAKLRRHREAERLVMQGNELFDGWATGPAIKAYERAEALLLTNGDSHNLRIVRGNLASARLLHAALNDVDRVEKAKRAYGGDDPYGERSPFRTDGESAARTPVVFRPGIDGEAARKRAEATCSHFERGAPTFRICVDSAFADIILGEDRTVSFQCAGVAERSQRQACARREFERLNAINAKLCADGGCQERAAGSDEQYVYWCPNEPGIYGGGRYVEPGAGCSGSAAPVRRIATGPRDKLRAQVNAAIATGGQPAATMSAALQDRIGFLRQQAEALPPGKERDAILANLKAAAGGKAAPGPAEPKGPAGPRFHKEPTAAQAPDPDPGGPAQQPGPQVSREDEILGGNPAWKPADQLQRQPRGRQP